MVEEAESTQADMLQCGFRRYDKKTGNTISLDMCSNPHHPIENPLMYYGIPFLHTGAPAKLYRRALFGNDVRFADSGRFEDVPLVFKFLTKCKTIAFLNEPLYEYIVSANSISTFGTKDELVEQMAQSREILLDLKAYYLIHAPKIQEEGLIDALAFLRYGIGLTTRSCLSHKVKRHAVIRQTKQFLNTNFPQWKTTPYLKSKNMSQFSKKTIFVQWCRHLYRINLFSFFVTCYYAFTRITKKDIKP